MIEWSPVSAYPMPSMPGEEGPVVFLAWLHYTPARPGVWRYGVGSGSRHPASKTARFTVEDWPVNALFFAPITPPTA